MRKDVALLTLMFIIVPRIAHAGNIPSMPLCRRRRSAFTLTELLVVIAIIAILIALLYKPERAGMTDAFLWVVDVDRLYEEITARGAITRLPPTNQTWGTREAGICDPDGNVLVFATKPPPRTA